MNALIHGVLSILFKKWPKDVYNDMGLNALIHGVLSILFKKWPKDVYNDMA
ncbi:hypothetical protein ACWWJF_03605 [Symbiopectobacterium sp. Eva_TO]